MDGYQHLSVAFHDVLRRGILADEAGLGKTLCSLALFSYLRVTNKARKCAIICPSTAVLSTWKKEILNNTTFNPIIVLGEYISGQNARDRAYNEVNDRNPLLVTNYEIFRRDYMHKFFSGVDLVIFDESSAFKNYSSATAEAARYVGSKVPRILLLNATPAEISVLDVYSQINVLYPGLLGKMKDYRARYCEEIIETIERYDRSSGRTIEMKIPKVVGYKNIEELRARIDWMILRRLPGDVGIKYAEPIIQPVELPFSIKLYEVYNDLKAGLVRQHDRIRNVAFGVKFNYMLMACVAPSLVTKKPYEDGESPKFDAVLSMAAKLKPAGERFVLFSRWRVTLMALEKVMQDKGFKVATITGRENKLQRLKNQDDLNEGKLDALLINIAGAKSLNFHTARFLIFLDSTFNPSTNKQVLYRLLRRTQKSDKVFVYVLTIGKTVEQKVLKILAGRQQMSDDLFSSKALSIAEMRQAFTEELNESQAVSV